MPVPIVPRNFYDAGLRETGSRNLPPVRRKGKILGLIPLYPSSEYRVKGLIRLLSLSLLEFSVRQRIHRHPQVAFMINWVLYLRLFTNAAIPGWTSSVLPIYFLGGIQLLSIGILCSTQRRLRG